MTRKLIKLHAAAPYHPPGYVDDVLSGSTVDEAAGTYDCPPEHWATMVAKYRTHATVNPPHAPAQPQLCPRCNQPMIGGCRRQCRACGYSSGCGD